jgi:hypothetical protein
MKIKISNSGGRLKDLFTVYLTIFPIDQMIQHQMKITIKEAILIKNKHPSSGLQHKNMRQGGERGRLIIYCLSVFTNVGRGTDL